MSARPLAVVLSVLCVAGVPAQEKPQPPVRPAKPAEAKPEPKKPADPVAGQRARVIERLVRQNENALRNAELEAVVKAARDQNLQAVTLKLQDLTNAQKQLEAHQVQLLKRAVRRQPANNGQVQWVTLNGLRPVKSAPKTSSLVTGEFEKALDGLDAARKKMGSTEDIDEAMAAVDRAQRLLMEARAALWTQKDARKRGQKNGTGKDAGDAAGEAGKPVAEPEKKSLVRPVRVRRDA